MPGMLSPEEMSRLADAKGVEFDRLFLEGMIKHHSGALTMVEQLFATPGAGQESEIFAFASDVDADQRMEIDRMSVDVEGAAEMRSVVTRLFWLCALLAASATGGIAQEPKATPDRNRCRPACRAEGGSSRRRRRRPEHAARRQPAEA